MKRNTAEKLNAIGWFLLAIGLMYMAYKAWSVNGPYTMGSFCASALFHGGPCFLGWILVGEAIEKHFNGK